MGDRRRARARAGSGPAHRPQPPVQAPLAGGRPALLLVVQEVRPPSGPRPRAAARRAPAPWSRPPRAAGASSGARGPGARPPLCDPLQAGRAGGEAVMALEPRGRQRWVASGGEGAAPRATLAPHDCRFVVGTPRPRPCQRTAAPPPLWQAVLGMALGLREGLRNLTPSRALPPWRRHARQGLRHRGAAGGWAGADAPHQRPPERLGHLVHEERQRGRGGCEEAARAAHLPRAAIAPAPEPCVAHGRWAPSAGEEDAPAGLRQAWAAGRGLPRERPPGVLTRQEIRHRARRPGHAARAHGLLDGRNPPVGSVAPRPHAGAHREPQCGLGQRASPCECRAGGWTKGGTAPVETAAHLQGESQARLQGGARARVRRGGPPGLATGGARALERLQGLRCGGDRSGGGACPSRGLHE
jgi:hypothetical protein